MHSPDTAPNQIVHDKSVASRHGETVWSSDPVAMMLCELGVPYIVLVPG